MNSGPSADAAAKLGQLAQAEMLKIADAIRNPESLTDRRLVAHAADKSLARSRAETYDPSSGCPRCWVLEGKISPLERTGIHHADEYGIRCPTCNLTELLPER